MGNNMITYAKLQDGSWGIRSKTQLTPGMSVVVTKRDGSTKNETVGVAAGRYGEDFFHAVVATPHVTAHAPKVGNLSGILALFDKARGHLNRPAIVLGVPAVAGLAIRINVAGDRAKVPGSLTVLDASRDEETGSRDWLGRILLDGTFQPSRQITALQLPAITERLRAFSADPAGIAAEHGRLTGRCCFCNRALEDERSTAVGYGPVCARRFGLAWGKAATFFETQADIDAEERAMMEMEAQGDREETIRDERNKHLRRMAMELDARGRS